MRTSRSGCPVNAAVEVAGDRWSLIVLRDVMFTDRRYFRELQRGSEGAPPPTSSPVACATWSPRPCSPVMMREPVNAPQTASPQRRSNAPSIC